MASSSSSQHRCVFVGNIPYDATEEQLVEICREVGPVVSFRLVIDRETGKPKGYGFCEYKDEETALSARRNLQGYEINGRQLRVDFAENDKGSDRNREQGRGGPGLATNIDSQKPSGSIDSVHHQPIGLHLAITAAAVMAGALGAAQAGLPSSQSGLQGQSAPANDPLTLHLAKMSRSQLTEILSELKKMAMQNKEIARELLLGRPQLLKAVFQAEIMLGMVTPQVLQMPNIRQAPGQPTKSSWVDSQLVQHPTIHPLPGLPPLAQKAQSGLIPKVQEGQVSIAPQSSLVHNQFSAQMQPMMQSRIHIPQHTTGRVIPPAVVNASLLNRKLQPLPQHSRQVAASSLNAQTAPTNAATQSSLLQCPLSDTAFQPGPSIMPGFAQKTNVFQDSIEARKRPSKLQKFDDALSVVGSSTSNVTGPGPSQALGFNPTPVSQVPVAEKMPDAQKQVSQLPPDVESVLLQQVLNLTPEQLSSLPPEQRQQVLQLQQALRRDQMQPS